MDPGGPPSVWAWWVQAAAPRSTSCVRGGCYRSLVARWATPAAAARGCRAIRPGRGVRTAVPGRVDAGAWYGGEGLVCGLPGTGPPPPRPGRARRGPARPGRRRRAGAGYGEQRAEEPAQRGARHRPLEELEGDEGGCLGSGGHGQRPDQAEPAPRRLRARMRRDSPPDPEDEGRDRRQGGPRGPHGDGWRQVGVAGSGEQDRPLESARGDEAVDEHVAGEEPGRRHGEPPCRAVIRKGLPHPPKSMPGP